MARFLARLLVIVLAISNNIGHCGINSFLENNLAPAHIKKAIDKTYDTKTQEFKAPKVHYERLEKARNIYKLEVDDKSYLIKPVIYRLIGRNDIQRIITLLSLEHIRVPKKYIYQVPEKTGPLNSENYRVVSEYIVGDKPHFSKIAYDVALELLLLGMSTIWGDLHENNIIKNGDFYYIIDTEPSTKNLFDVSKEIETKFFNKLSTDVKRKIRVNLKDTFYAEVYSFLNDG